MKVSGKEGLPNATRPPRIDTSALKKVLRLLIEGHRIAP